MLQSNRIGRPLTGFQAGHRDGHLGIGNPRELGACLATVSMLVALLGSSWSGVLFLSLSTVAECWAAPKLDTDDGSPRRVLDVRRPRRLPERGLLAGESGNITVAAVDVGQTISRTWPTNRVSAPRGVGRPNCTPRLRFGRTAHRHTALAVDLSVSPTNAGHLRRWKRR